MEEFFLLIKTHINDWAFQDVVEKVNSGKFDQLIEEKFNKSWSWKDVSSYIFWTSEEHDEKFAEKMREAVEEKNK